MVLLVSTPEEMSSIEKPRIVKEETSKFSTDTSSESISHYAERMMRQFHQGSHLECTVMAVPDVSPSDVQDGPALGEGGFAIVTAVEYDGQPCAKKALRNDILQGTSLIYHIAATDLWKEAEFLSALKHPHIVALKAKHLSFDNMDENFLVVERLDQTLAQKMAEWREKDRQIRHSPKLRLQLLQQRLRACKDICDTLRFLHDHNVIYRDLKAENLGFDHEGKVKLFGTFSLPLETSSYHYCFAVVTVIVIVRSHHSRSISPIQHD